MFGQAALEYKPDKSPEKLSMHLKAAYYVALWPLMSLLRLLKAVLHTSVLDFLYYTDLSESQVSQKKNSLLISWGKHNNNSSCV